MTSFDVQKELIGAELKAKSFAIDGSAGFCRIALIKDEPSRVECYSVSGYRYYIGARRVTREEMFSRMKKDSVDQ